MFSAALAAPQAEARRGPPGTTRPISLTRPLGMQGSVHRGRWATQISLLLNFFKSKAWPACWEGP